MADPIKYPFTAIPNSYLDEHMRTLKTANAKLALIFIFRRTLGAAGRPTEAAISLAEFREYLGVSHDATIEAALQELKDKGYITIRQEGSKKSIKHYGYTGKAFVTAKNADISAKSEDRITEEALDTPVLSSENADTNLQEIEIAISNNRSIPSIEIAEVETRQPAQEAAPQAPKETSKERVKEISKEIAAMTLQDLQVEIASTWNILKMLDQEEAKLDQNAHHLTPFKIDQQRADINRRRQARLDELATLEAERDTRAPNMLPGETVEELAPAAELPQTSEQQEEDRQRLRAIKDELSRWREDLKMCLGANAFGKWRGHTRDEIEQKIRELTTQKNALLARVSEQG